MNKEQLVLGYHKALELMSLSSSELRLGAGGALVMLGLREETGDLDLEVTDVVYNSLLKCGYVETIDGKFRYIRVSEEVDIHEVGDILDGDFIDGVFILSPIKLLQFKESLNRPKDQDDIVKLRAFIEAESK